MIKKTWRDNTAFNEWYAAGRRGVGWHEDSVVSCCCKTRKSQPNVEGIERVFPCDGCCILLLTLCGPVMAPISAFRSSRRLPCLVKKQSSFSFFCPSSPTASMASFKLKTSGKYLRYLHGTSGTVLNIAMAIILRGKTVVNK